MDQKLIVTPNPIGRPTVVTLDTVAKLLSVLQRGISITKACIYAHIDRATFYRKYKEDPEFRNKVDDARNFATVVAAEVVVDDIVKNKNVQTAKWYLERKDPEEYAQKPLVQINTHKNEQRNYFMPVSYVNDMYASGFNPTSEEMMDLLEGDGSKIVDHLNEVMPNMPQHVKDFFDQYPPEE